MASNISHMEYSIWPRKYVIWSTSYDIRKSPLKLILNTPYGTRISPYGVLHMATIQGLMEYSMEH